MKHAGLRPLRSTLCLLIVGLLLTGAAGLGFARTPVVVFQVENDAGRAAAERCGEIWLAEGSRITADILPGGPAAPADTVTCLILNTAAFERHFAGSLPDWGVGVAMPGGRVVAVDYQRLPAVGRGLREVFLHEMVHALLFQGSGGAWLPTWLHEGTAMLYSGEWKFSDTVSLVLDGHVPDLYRLQGRFPIPHERADRAYRTSLLAVSRLRTEFGDGIIADLVRETRARGDFPAAFAAATGTELAAFHQDFAAAMQLRYGWILFLTRWPGLFVLTAVVFAVGAARKMIINRRRLNDMEDHDDEGGPAAWPRNPPPGA